MDDKEYISLLENNLGVLESYGIHYLSTVFTSLFLLKKYYAKELQLTDEQVSEILEGIYKVTVKHEQMIKLSVEDRNKYVDPDSPNK
jgi:hypothetical protein